MFERGLEKDDVLAVVRAGQVIGDYPDDSPYPSRLLLGSVRGRAIRLVLAHDTETDTAVVVTVYEPDAGVWTEDFTTRRSQS
jgi:hypothetical protein